MTKIKELKHEDFYLLVASQQVHDNLKKLTYIHNWLQFILITIDHNLYHDELNLAKKLYHIKWISCMLSKPVKPISPGRLAIRNRAWSSAMSNRFCSPWRYALCCQDTLETARATICTWLIWTRWWVRLALIIQ